MPKPKVSIEEFKARMDVIPEKEFIRLAAFIDGEGCITISSSPRRGRMAVRQHSMIMTISNTSVLLFDWLLGTFGGRYTRAHYQSRLPVYSWHINEWQCEEILRRCLPYFIIKREQAEIALAYREMRNRRRETLRNSRVTPEELQQRNNFQLKICALNGARSRFAPTPQLAVEKGA